MVHQPPILVLDEPTAGVDIELRQNLWENVKNLNKQGVTIMLTTHYLFEAQEMSDRIAILNKGNLVALDTTKNLLNKIKTKKIIFKVNKPIDLSQKKINGLSFASNLNDEITTTYERNRHKIEDIIDIIKSEGVEIIDISTEDGNLEDVFIQLTKN
jgi:ABC-2 type transport system ATP-binding protein